MVASCVSPGYSADGSEEIGLDAAEERVESRWRALEEDDSVDGIAGPGPERMEQEDDSAAAAADIAS